MKRLIAALLILALLVSLCACRKKQESASEAAAPESAAPPAAETVPEAGAEPEETDPPFPEDMVGTWILVDSNDTKLTEELYPGVTEKGGTMEIGADGLLFWTVGSSSGAGRIILVEGDDVSAQLSQGSDGEMVPVAGLLERSNESFALYMTFFGVDLIWVHVPPKTQS